MKYFKKHFLLTTTLVAALTFNGQVRAMEEGNEALLRHFTAGRAAGDFTSDVIADILEKATYLGSLPGTVERLERAQELDADYHINYLLNLQGELTQEISKGGAYQGAMAAAPSSVRKTSLVEESAAVAAEDHTRAETTEVLPLSLAGRAALARQEGRDLDAAPSVPLTVEELQRAVDRYVRRPNFERLERELAEVREQHSEEESVAPAEHRRRLMALSSELRMKKEDFRLRQVRNKIPSREEIMAFLQENFGRTTRISLEEFTRIMTEIDFRQPIKRN